MTEHLPVQRYYLNARLHTSDVMQAANPNPSLTERSGDWVLYAEHIAALRMCKQRVLDAADEAIRDALSGDGRNLYAELLALAAIHALREGEDAMTHDRLCYANADCEANENYLCDLIATVREEERDAAVQRVQALGWDVTYFSEVAQLESISRAKAIAAIKGDKS